MVGYIPAVNDLLINFNIKGGSAILLRLNIVSGSQIRLPVLDQSWIFYPINRRCRRHVPGPALMTWGLIHAQRHRRLCIPHFLHRLCCIHPLPLHKFRQEVRRPSNETECRPTPAAVYILSIGWVKGVTITT